MPGQSDDRTPVERFKAYNPYAVEADELASQGDLEGAAIKAQLAVAFELKQLNGAIRFGNRGRSS